MYERVKQRVASALLPSGHHRVDSAVDLLVRDRSRLGGEEDFAVGAFGALRVSRWIACRVTFRVTGSLILGRQLRILVAALCATKILTRVDRTTATSNTTTLCRKSRGRLRGGAFPVRREIG